MGHIFISYARQNKDEVDLVVSQLESMGIKAWIDRNMNPGDIVPDEIAKAISTAEKFFLFITSASVISNYVQSELNFAITQKIPVIPIILKPTEIPSGIKLHISHIEHVILSDGLSKGISQLALLAGQPSQQVDINFLLQSLADRVSKNTIFITPDLIKPKDETSQNIVVGTTINLKQLRDGCFMLRPSTLAQAISSLDAHVNNNLSVENSKINTFWIDGRSGSGKSVFLLQIMQDLILKRGIKAFWLANDLELLIKLLEEWARLGIDLTEPIYIFIDDFNAPQNRELIDYRPISNLLNDIRNEGIQWPVLVTCSPPDYREDFQINGNDVDFRIQTWSLPLLSNAEKSNLLAWFNKRTRETPKMGPAFEQTDGLVLSMMFELRYGDMKEFGRRFKARLEAAGLIEALSLPLALNRLYIWPPKKWIDEFTPEQKEALAKLNSDHDFSVLTTEKQNDEYIRLTHPHLSDVIYKAIRPQKPGIIRAHDLANAFERALLSNDILASRILQVVAKGEERITTDLDNETLVKETNKIWKKNAEIIQKIDPMLMASFWTSWSIWAFRDKNVISEFGGVSLVDEAVKAMGRDHYAWGILWLKLWNCESGNNSLINSGLVWLRNKSNHQNLQWAFIWQALLQHPNDLPEGTSVKSLIKLGTQWLVGKEEKDQWAFVWQTLLQHPNDLPERTSVKSLIQLGSQWLVGKEEKDQWKFVWETLLQHPNDLPQGTSVTSLIKLGTQWLVGKEEKDQWNFVWETLLQHPNDLPEGTSVKSLIQLGSQCLVGKEEKDQWAFMWQALLQHPNDLPEGTSVKSLIQLGSQWLVGKEEKDQWKFVWETLLQYPNDLPEGTSVKSLIQLGSQWLVGKEGKDQWNFVWETLLQHPNDLPEGTSVKSLIQLGTQWLVGKEEKDQWTFVWQTIHENKTLLENSFYEFILIGAKWLNNHQGRADWNYIWRDIIRDKDLFDEKINFSDLLEMGTSWLINQEEKDQWAFVWQTLLQHSNDLPEGTSVNSLIQLGTQWLVGKEEKDQWKFVWQALLQHPNDLPEGTSVKSLIQLGTQWLVGKEEKDQWNFVWEILIQYPNDLPEGTSVKSIIQLGTQWLVGKEEKDQWAFMWQALLQHPNDLPEGTSVNSLIQLGTQWLVGKEEKDQWNFVWETLLQYPHDLPEGTSVKSLIQLGSQWLVGKEKKDQWKFVWETLLQHPHDLPEGTSVNSLIQLGTQWLVGKEEKYQWAFVWQTILKNSYVLEENNFIKFVDTGLIWLKVNQHRNDWPFIWGDLLKIRSLSKTTRSEILNIGLEWLDGRERHQSWSFVFEKCLQSRVVTRDLLTKGINWVYSNESRPETPGIAFEIANHYELIHPSIKYEFHQWIKKWVMKSHPNNRSWPYGWIAYWRFMPTIESVELALKWIEVNPENTVGIKKILRILTEDNRLDILNKLEQWSEKHPNHPISNTIKNQTGK